MASGIKRHGRRGALVAPCYVWSHFYYPLLIVNLLIYSIKMICTKRGAEAPASAATARAAKAAKAATTEAARAAITGAAGAATTKAATSILK